jgi:hypothetical protein
MCQYKRDGSSVNEINAAIFCLSLCHRENILHKIDPNDPEFRTALKLAINESELLKTNVNFLLDYSPLVDWNGVDQTVTE